MCDADFPRPRLYDLFRKIKRKKPTVENKWRLEKRSTEAAGRVLMQTHREAFTPRTAHELAHLSCIAQAFRHVGMSYRPQLMPGKTCVTI